MKVGEHSDAAAVRPRRHRRCSAAYFPAVGFAPAGSFGSPPPGEGCLLCAGWLVGAELGVEPPLGDVLDVDPLLLGSGVGAADSDEPELSDGVGVGVVFDFCFDESLLPCTTVTMVGELLCSPCSSADTDRPVTSSTAVIEPMTSTNSTALNTAIRRHGRPLHHGPSESDSVTPEPNVGGSGVSGVSGAAPGTVTRPTALPSGAIEPSAACPPAAVTDVAVAETCGSPVARTVPLAGVSFPVTPRTHTGGMARAELVVRTLDGTLIDSGTDGRDHASETGTDNGAGRTQVGSGDSGCDSGERTCDDLAGGHIE